MPQQTHRITIAIDGYSSCGKSTLARALARRLHYLHIDSGAMYRAVTLYFLRHKINIENSFEVKEALKNISIHLAYENDAQVTWLNNENVEKLIRESDINEFVSNVSTLSSIRKEMVLQQRRMGEGKGLVMDGRDIGTVVFPEAELKLFTIADIDVRVERRWNELHTGGFTTSRDEVRRNLLLRDQIDSTRHDSPLQQASDAIVIDTSYLSEKEQLQIAYDLANSAIFKEGSAT